MKKGLDLFRIAFQINVLVVAVLSFFPCVFECSSSSADMFEGQWKTGDVFGNAKWAVLILSIIELILLCFDKRIINTFFKIFSFTTFLLTLLWSIYLIVTSPSLIGSCYDYKWTTLGYVVLVFSLLPFIGFIIYEHAKKRNTGPF